MRKITKRAVLWVVILGAVAGLKAQSVGPGRIDARFGVDGDIEADAVRYGRASGSGVFQLNDDWFVNPSVTSLGGLGIINISNASFHKSVLQSHVNYREQYIFTEGMSVPKLTRSGGYVLLDALYARDHQGTDKTKITGPGSVKLIDDPSTWQISASGGLNAKSDIMEFYSHVRRKGTTVWDSLFFYFGVGIYGTNGTKNIVAELFVNDVKYDTTLNKMTGLGGQGGRVAWSINGQGGIVGIGDMIIAMTYTPGGGGGFVLEPQIWMRKTTYDSFAPGNGLGPGGTDLVINNFNMGAQNWQTSGLYGYVHIEPKAGSTALASWGVANGGSSMAPPWGTSVANGFTWSSTYDQDQFIELSINLTFLGVDPAQFVGIDPCSIPYRSIIFYSQTAASVSSSPEDFSGPYPFWRYPAINHQMTGGNHLTCNTPTAAMSANNPNPLAYYWWEYTPFNSSTTTVVASGANYTATQPGIYEFKSAPLEGCWAKDSTTIVIYEDKVAPIAGMSQDRDWYLGTGIDTFDILDGDPTYYFLKLYTGDTALSADAYNAIPGVSIDSIAFVDHNDFIWALTRYNGGANTVINDSTFVSDIFQGDYYTFTLTGLRNGCIASQKILITQLPVNIMNFNCRAAGDMVQLNWSAADEQGLKYYEIQRTENGSFKTIGRINASENPFVVNKYTFRDNNPLRGWNSYRLRMVMENGNSEYSTICMSSYGDNMLYGGISVVPNPAASHLGVIVGFSEEFPEVKWRMVNTSGAEVMNGTALINAGAFSLDVSKLPAGVYSLEVYNQSQLVTSKVMINK